MVARRMADERLLAVITSNSSHSVQKSCCVIATSSSTMRTFGFVIIFFPVIHQNGSGDLFNSHLRPLPFRRMPGLKALTRTTLLQSRCQDRREAGNVHFPPKTQTRPPATFLHVHMSRHPGGRVC